MRTATSAAVPGAMPDPPHSTPPGAGRDPAPSRRVSETTESIIFSFSSHPQPFLSPACQRMGCTSNRHVTSQHSKQETTLLSRQGISWPQIRFSCSVPDTRVHPHELSHPTQQQALPMWMEHVHGFMLEEGVNAQHGIRNNITQYTECLQPTTTA